jgi:hypothetical protein
MQYAASVHQVKNDLVGLQHQSKIILESFNLNTFSNYNRNLIAPLVMVHII